MPRQRKIPLYEFIGNSKKTELLEENYESFEEIALRNSNSMSLVEFIKTGLEYIETGAPLYMRIDKPTFMNTVKMLLDNRHPEYLNSQSCDYHLTAFAYVCSIGNMELVKLFMKNNSVLFNDDIDLSGYSYEIRQKVDILRYSFREFDIRGLHKFSDLSLREEIDISDDEGTLEIRIERSWHGDYFSINNCNIHTPLQYACAKKKYAVVELLLNDLRCDPNKLCFGGFTVLSYALQKKDVKLASILLQHRRVDPNAGNPRYPSIVFAIHPYMDNAAVKNLQILVSNPRFGSGHEDIFHKIKQAFGTKSMNLALEYDSLLKKTIDESTVRKYGKEKINHRFLRVCADGVLDELKDILKKKPSMKY